MATYVDSDYEDHSSNEHVVVDERTPLLIADKPAREEHAKATRKSYYAIICILFTALWERMTWFSVVGNLVLYCTNILMFTSAEALTLIFIFHAMSYILPLLLGFIADTIAGKHNALLGSFMVSLVGVAILTAIAIPYMKVTDGSYDMTVRQKRIYAIIGLLFIAIGTGGARANLQPFGGQQIEERGGEDSLTAYFFWSYWFMTIGGAIAFTVVAYVQQEISFVLGYVMCTLAIMLALMSLLLGRKQYIYRQPEGSIFSRIFKILGLSLKQLKCPPNSDNLKCLDRVKESHGGKYPDEQVEEVKSLGAMVLIFLVMCPYGTAHSQMQSTFYLQGERLRLTHGGFTMPISTLNLVSTTTVLILIPIMDRLIYPFLQKRGINCTTLRRLGIGMVLAALAITTAGILEVLRKNSIDDGRWIHQEIGGKVFKASEISIFAQFPQFIIIGASEAFGHTAVLEFAFAEAPTAMQSSVTGIYYFCNAFGYFFGTLLVTLVNTGSEGNKWLPDDINDGYLERFFFLLAGIMILDIIIYCIVSLKYKYTHTVHGKM